MDRKTDPNCEQCGGTGWLDKDTDKPRFCQPCIEKDLQAEAELVSRKTLEMKALGKRPYFDFCPHFDLDVDDCLVCYDEAVIIRSQEARAREEAHTIKKDLLKKLLAHKKWVDALIEHLVINDEQHRCIDCRWHAAEHPSRDCAWGESCPGIHDWSKAEPFCPHFTPEWWTEQGYVRDWGDASVGAPPWMEILRKDTEERTEYLILNIYLRRPVTITVDKQTGGSGGGY